MADPKQFLTSINLNYNELIKAVAQILGTDPGTLNQGNFWFNSSDGRLKYTDGTTIKTIADLSDVVGLLDFKGGYDASTNTPDLETPTAGTIKKGDYYVVTVGGTFFTEELKPGDSLFAKVDDPSALSDWTTVQTNVDLATETAPGIIELATQAETDAETDDQRAVTPLKLATWFSNKNGVVKYVQTGVSVGATPGAQVINHQLGSEAVHVTVYDAATKEEYELEVSHTDSNNVTIDANGATKTVDVVVTG